VKDHQLIGKRISVGLGIVTLAAVFERLSVLQSNLATFRIANDEFHVQAAGGAGIQFHQFAMPSFQRAPRIPTGTSGHADSWRTARGKALCGVDLRRHIG